MDPEELDELEKKLWPSTKIRPLRAGAKIYQMTTPAADVGVDSDDVYQNGLADAVGAKEPK